MKFCRSCGTALGGGTGSGAPAYGAPPMGHPPMGHAPMQQPPPPMGPPPGFGGPPPQRVPSGPMPMNPPMPAPSGFGGPPPGASPPVRPSSGAQNIICPRCSASTPAGFAYCQQCGLPMAGMQPTDPGTSARPRSPSAAQPPIDPQAQTMAADGLRAGSVMPPAGGAMPMPMGPPMGGPLPMPMATPAAAPSAGPSWGTAVLVNRDGSDGQRFPLTGEYLTVGRAGADIAFDEDRFLARQHARFERSADGVVKVHPLDALNGVFRKATEPVELVDGMTILVGREVLRFERLDAEEVKLAPLVRHGVALFGSPPREPYARLVQIIPSGGYRDVRHLNTEEVVLGREEGDIVFRDDAFMSRRHAAVNWDGKRAQLTDLGSSNGTFVRLNGPTALRSGDHVRLGDQLLRIELGR